MPDWWALSERLTHRWFITHCHLCCYLNWLIDREVWQVLQSFVVFIAVFYILFNDEVSRLSMRFSTVKSSSNLVCIWIKGDQGSLYSAVENCVHTEADNYGVANAVWMIQPRICLKFFGLRQLSISCLWLCNKCHRTDERHSLVEHLHLSTSISLRWQAVCSQTCSQRIWNSMLNFMYSLAKRIHRPGSCNLSTRILRL